jgi:hypothetical protein
MFIIDHFEVQDEGGQPVPIDEEAVSPWFLVLGLLTDRSQ